MKNSTKRNLIVAVVASLLTGGGLSAPAIIDAVNPAQKVSVVAFSVAKSPHTIGSIKAGDKYCEVTVKHRDTGIKVPVPAPAKACGVLKKGQQLTVRGKEIVAGLPKVK